MRRDYATRGRLQKSTVNHRKVASVRQLVPKDKEWLRLATQGSQVGLWHWDELTKELFWDTKTREMFGIDPSGEVTLQTFYKALHPEDHNRVKDEWRYALEHQLPYQLDYRSLRPDGTIRWIHALGSGYHDKAGKPLNMVGVVFDVSERKQAELHRLELSGRLINAQEQERSRLARELHDDFSQRLAMVAIDLEEAEMIPDLPGAASNKLHELWSEVCKIGDDLHSLSHRLHSSTLDALGLVVGIQSYCKEIERKQGLRIDVSHQGVPKPMHPEIALCLFRIVQEALRNVSKHGRASRVEVRLQGCSESISLTLRDNGIGFDLSKEYASAGIGIQSMNERARVLAGTFEIESAPMKGTRINVKVPLKKHVSLGAAT